jgi:sensor histidine kinase regulating citrate/malate metabolism
MVKNALESSPENAVVTLGANASEKGTEFWVHNESAMPREVQLQVFQRSFSTKGEGRGLGTYSIKLLTERYLNGKVTFTSSMDDGTTFRVLIPDLEK